MTNVIKEEDKPTLSVRITDEQAFQLIYKREEVYVDELDESLKECKKWFLLGANYVRDERL